MSTAGEHADDRLEHLVEYLRETRGLDFSGYKRPSLSRRIHKRMDDVGIADIDEYRDFLEVHPDEQIRLVDTILINVTGFFRDEASWAHLAEQVVPAIVRSKAPGEVIRVWSAGCATGEEAYTLAMVFADHLGVDEFASRVKIFATDVDEGALAIGRRAMFSDRALEPVPDDKRERFFSQTSGGYVFRPDCRRAVIFGRNDVTSDAPISRLDLLVCRNVLMYFVSDTQRGVLQRFHYGLNDGGFLFLGRAETILAHSDLFDVVDAPMRIFRRAPLPLTGTDLLADRQHTDPSPTGSNTLQRLALAATPVAQLVVDIDGHLVGANAKARSMFGVTADVLNRPFWELQASFRPTELRPHVEQAYAQGEPVVLRDVTRPLADGQLQFLEVTIAPLRDPGGLDLGVSLTFTDVTELGRLRVELESSARSLAAANQDLFETNEELETSNEELQSTNEELETTNEELQSANEELETMNEELQSGNEELETMNEELLAQTNQIERGERFLASILDSLVAGLVVVDSDLDVLVWNRAVENMFGVRSEETTGRSFLALDIGLPVGDVGPLLHAALSDEEIEARHLTLDAIDRRGQPFRCSVGVQRLAGAAEDAEHVVMVLLALTDEETP